MLFKTLVKNGSIFEISFYYQEHIENHSRFMNKLKRLNKRRKFLILIFFSTDVVFSNHNSVIEARYLDQLFQG
ncbi:hypothetical protein BpHYR1_023279 [Brachionus plicatilis]|uniref:Uncharacterized protein n=1 Tax=Brachionus plicatilis TaxID=10195 RepID=A0A3M7Q4F2_BRAPC|nr:hypothetical protein BpHYR1_023279 [Brachionus plicatilis]